MKQKVFVQGRETQPVYLKQDYVPSRDEGSRSGFSEIGFSQMDNGRKAQQNGFRIRQRGEWKPSPEGNTWKRKTE